MLSSIIGPNREQAFIAKNYIFIEFDSQSETKTPCKEYISPTEIQWLSALKLQHLPWRRGMDIGRTLMMLPVDSYCVSPLCVPINKMNMFVILSTGVVYSSVSCIVQTRLQLLSFLEHMYMSSTNYSMRRHWTLLNTMIKLVNETSKNGKS